MGKKLETQVNQLFLKETVIADIFRGHRGFYTDEPDESLPVQDLIVNVGRSYIAQRISGADAIASAMAHVAVGTVATAADLADTLVTGEVARKGTAINSAITNNVWTAVATFGGNADSVTSVVLREAGVFNHAGSGEGTMLQRVTFAAVTLADSDIYRITLETNIGSNTI